MSEIDAAVPHLPPERCKFDEAKLKGRRGEPDTNQAASGRGHRRGEIGMWSTLELSRRRKAKRGM